MFRFRMRRIACAALLLALASGSGCGKKGGDDPTKGPVAARVNGRPVYENDITREMNHITSLMREGGQPPADANSLQGIRDNALNNLVDKMLLLDRVEKEGLTPTAAAVDSEIVRVKAQYGNEAAFQSRLQSLNLSEQDIRSELQFGLCMRRLAEKHQDVVPPASPEEAAKYYAENPSQFIAPEQVRASHILIRVDAAAPEADRAAAKARAQEALAAVRGGQDFAKVASEKSEDPGSAQNGGDLGFFARGRMIPAFENVAFTLPVGEVSDLIETQFGYHIIRVTDKTTSRPIPLEEIQAQLIAMLDRSREERIVRELIAEARKNAKIEMTKGGDAG